MKLAVGALVLGGAFALPSATTPSPLGPAQPSSPVQLTPPENANAMSDRCAVNDAGIWTKENWEDKGMYNWFSNWWMDYLTGPDSDKHLDEAFAGYWGLGPSFTCDIDNECQAPECSRLKRPDQAFDYEQASMFLASMANFNNQYARIYDALDGAKLDFAAIITKIQQTFYPAMTPADMAALQGLNGGTVAVGILAIFAGPVKEVVSVGKEIFAGIARGVGPILTAADKSIANIAELEAEYSKRMDGVRREFATMHDAILKIGTYGSTQTRHVFEHGDYVQRSDIAVLHDIGVEDLRAYLNEMFLAMTISNAWVKQGAYIFSREMDEAMCNEYQPILSMLPHLCYEGRIYWLNVNHDSDISGTTGIDKISGMDELESELGVHFHDAMRSSIDAFNKGGYTYNPAEDFDDIFEGDIREKIAAGSRYRGIWNIPVCEVESSEQFGETKIKGPDDFSWSIIDTNLPDDTESTGLQVCLCATAKDRNGVSILELPDPGAGSFRDLLGNKGYDRCKLDDSF